MVVIEGRDVAHHHDVMEKVCRFRHKMFVDHRKWTDLRKPDEREIDQFDHARAVHLIGLEEDKIVAYSRLLPTNEPHILDSVFPEILAGATSPKGPAIWEWTRLAVAREKREGHRGTDPTTGRLFVAPAELCLDRGIAAIVGEGHPLMLTRMLELGWKTRPLALPVVYKGEVVLPLLCEIDETTLARSRHVLGIGGRLLSRAPPARCPTPSWREDHDEDQRFSRGARPGERR